MALVVPGPGDTLDPPGDLADRRVLPPSRVEPENRYLEVRRVEVVAAGREPVGVVRQ
ncbi:MAG TPA: hypothetical protein VGM69_20200 [Chloroflexota bacterium]